MHNNVLRVDYTRIDGSVTYLYMMPLYNTIIPFVSLARRPSERVHHRRRQCRGGATREASLSKLRYWTSPGKTDVTKWGHMGTHISCHTDKNRYYT